jgi:uncharacterized Rossmann fold enzyme
MKTLDPTAKQKVSYCIPLWQRDEQIKLAKARIAARIEKGEPKADPVAIVCFGPSLNDTWEKVKDFKYVISCSGSHKYLVDRGIVPTWHIEVDPREHKVKLIGTPQKQTEYLIAACCHPKVFDLLEGFNVRLWNVYDPTEEGLRELQPGEWAVTGGCSVGLRAITIAHFLGFSDLHVFGMDGSEGTVQKPLQKHAAEHPNQAKDKCVVPYGGVEWLSTPGFLEGARQTWHELDQLPAEVKVKFHGEGLVQAMAKDYKRKPKPTAMLAYAKPTLISDDYRRLNSQLHKDNLAYGVGGGRHAKTVNRICEKLKTRSVLDYGCGKGYLQKALDFPIWEYDPAIPGKDQAPRPADLVVCADVLEHVEPENINAVLDDLRRCVKKVGFFVIHTGPSKKTLADGRNAHVLQRDKNWWKMKLKKRFTIGQVQQVGHELFVVVSPKKKEKARG